MVPAIQDRARDGATGQVAPQRWALSPWARAFRRLGRPWLIKRHARRFCSPLRVEGAEQLSAVRSPALIVANHTSHLDSLIVLAVLPPTLYNRVAITAAADRFYRSTLKSAWFSLRYNAYQIARGGGSRALAYSESLLQGGWSLLIFPEGKRSRTGELLPFHPGPAILALRQNVPVLPLYIAGAAESLRPGTRWAQPAPVTVRVGRPLLLDQTSSVAEATAAIEEAVSRLGPTRTFAAAA
jgi:1-acyl-sn-glycerol-3-phosphate acyltransferase